MMHAPPHLLPACLHADLAHSVPLLQTERAFTTPDAMLEAAAVQVFRVGGLLPVVDDDGHVSGMECCWM